MSYLFISHSSQNNFEAVALHDWLLKEGWNDLFLDLDPTRGIVAGELWDKALHDVAHRCDAVLFLVSISALRIQAASNIANNNVFKYNSVAVLERALKVGSEAPFEKSTKSYDQFVL